MKTKKYKKVIFMGHTVWRTKKLCHNWQTHDVISILVKKNQNTTVWWRYIAISCIFSIGSLAPPGGQPSIFFSDCNSLKYWLSNEIWLIPVWLIGDAMIHADRDLTIFCSEILGFFVTSLWRHMTPNLKNPRSSERFWVALPAGRKKNWSRDHSDHSVG